MNDHSDSNAMHTDSPAAQPANARDKLLNFDMLATISARLDSLPARQKLTQAIAIQKLSHAIKKLQERGYTNDEIAAELRASGLPISARALTRHLAGKVQKSGRT